MCTFKPLITSIKSFKSSSKRSFSMSNLIMVVVVSCYEVKLKVNAMFLSLLAAKRSQGKCYLVLTFLLLFCGCTYTLLYGISSASTNLPLSLTF